MQIVENWTDIKGQVLGQTPSEQLPGFCEVAIDVEQASDVPGFRNLLSDTERTTLVVHFPKELTDELNIRGGHRHCLPCTQSVTAAVIYAQATRNSDLADRCHRIYRTWSLH